MQKLTEIKETYTATQKNTVDGAVTETQQTLTRYREVPFVKAWPRFGHYCIDLIFIYIFQFLFGTFLGVTLALTGTLGVVNNPYFSVYLDTVEAMPATAPGL